MAEESGSLHVPLDVRRVMLRAFTKKRHLQLQSDAVQFMYRTLEEHDLLAVSYTHLTLPTKRIV